MTEEFFTRVRCVEKGFQILLKEAIKEMIKEFRINQSW